MSVGPVQYPLMTQSGRAASAFDLSARSLGRSVAKFGQKARQPNSNRQNSHSDPNDRRWRVRTSNDPDNPNADYPERNEICEHSITHATVPFEQHKLRPAKTTRLGVPRSPSLVSHQGNPVAGCSVKLQ